MPPPGVSTGENNYRRKKSEYTKNKNYHTTANASAKRSEKLIRTLEKWGKYGNILQLENGCNSKSAPIEVVPDV